MNKTWRDRFRPVIAELIAKLGDIPVEEKLKAMRGTCPAQFRGYFPYRIWCDEVKVQLKIKVNGVPTNVPPGLHCEPGDVIAVIKREIVEQHE